MTAAVHKLLRLACLVLAFGILPSCSSPSAGTKSAEGAPEDKVYTMNELYNFRPARKYSAEEEQPNKVTKVKIYRLNTQQRFLPMTDRAIRFEQERLLYGAVTNRQRGERNGQYYSIMWRARGRTQPVTVRFEYRKQNTGLKIFTKEEVVSDVKASNVTKFQVISKEFHNDGAVTAWRATFLEGKEELAHADSFLWN